MSDRSNSPEEPRYEDMPLPNAHYPDAGDEPLPDAAPMGGKLQGAQQIEIRVADMQNNMVHFKIKTTTKLDKVINAFTERQNAAKGSLRFLFEGHRIVPSDTPESLEMDNGDTIEAHAEQTGGGLASFS